MIHPGGSTQLGSAQFKCVTSAPLTSAQFRSCQVNELKSSFTDRVISGEFDVADVAFKAELKLAERNQDRTRLVAVELALADLHIKANAPLMAMPHVRLRLFTWHDMAS